MNILVINAGSSSLKYQLIEMPSQAVKCVGLVERIGMEDAIFTHKKEDKEHSEVAPILNHEVGLKKIAKALLDPELGVINSVDEIKAIGHRVVHGGSRYSGTVLITEKVKFNIKDLFDLAPLHNPAHLTGIEVAETIFTSAKQTAVFDTAFHQTMPKEAYQYAIPTIYLKENKVRAYGFHGSSHKYVSEKAIEHLGEKSSKIITIHLGNGCSMSAIKDGKCIDTTMGFSPTNGLVMGTRAGDIDQSVIFFLMKKFSKSADEVNDILQKESGMKGLTGYSDLREIEEKAGNGNEECQIALNLAGYRIRKFIGAYTAALNGLDAIIFTAGIGENSILMRQMSCENLEFFGIELDEQKNDIRSKEIREIQKDTGKVKILVIPTNEELEIAKETYDLLK
ncbi:MULTISPECIES: acetate/propionate family kinase [unclassified Polaribacter]|jgi:acetate kinase|uniref:acetate/propionate family kinase n=1 Tax=unclassified Polaribacter TaxID=196858 RepID=UPI001C50020F|nr:MULTISPECIES: acetate kinase [unclassified Polaribacter]QXP65051.1 acetate kinase [Polaribacter sp. HaHaR_3_91]QXP67545.1 acetate kinase [Polaribacter sp. AHE13PA]QXP69703.1 acetate kinase [Polaribacter sp. R2A056_3_33]